MTPPHFFAELQRRNVYKVAVAYAVVAWLLLQALSILLPAFDAPPWVLRVFIAAIAAGFPLALVFAWAFELTPEGIKRSEEVAPQQSIAPKTGRKLIAITAALVVIAVALFVFQFVRSQHPAQVTSSSGKSPPSPASPTIPQKSIAVLPFENLSEEKANAFFTDGVQDEILTHLARIADLKVISRTSVMQYKRATQRNLREIGQQLGVAHVVEGSVQRADKRVRVNAQLIDARNDAHLWAQTYDRDLADVFAIQSEIAKAIADQLQAKLSPGEKKAIEQPPTTDLAAFDLYSRRNHFSSRQVSARRATQTSGRRLNFWMKRSSAIRHFSTPTASSPWRTKPFMQ
jgi:TolB-like protein